jgi:hypothetical protein
MRRPFAQRNVRRLPVSVPSVSSSIRLSSISGPVAVVAEIDQEVAGAGGEVVTLPPDARFRGQFGADAVAERDGVIAGLGDFLRVGLAIAIAGLVGGARQQLHRAAAGDDQHVHQVGDAGAGQVRVREAHHGRVAVMIP